MTMKSFVQVTIASSLLVGFMSQAFADTILDRAFSIETDHEVVTGVNVDLGPIEKQNTAFTFDWNQQGSIAANQDKVPQIEKFIAKIDDTSKLTKYEQTALGILLYKLGTYYTHVARDPDSGIAKLTAATAFLSSPEEKAWSNDQLAYAYEQRYAEDMQSADKEKSLFYSNKVLSELYPKQKNKIVAFAIGVKGLLESDDQKFADAEKSFKTALNMYDRLPDSKDNQYARIKNRLANTMLDQPGHEAEAMTMLKQVKKYWFSQESTKQNPYAARNLISLGKAYLKTGNTEAARDEFKSAVTIYKNVYGANTDLLVKPYELLAESYRKLGGMEEAARYEKKANDIVNT